MRSVAATPAPRSRANTIHIHPKKTLTMDPLTSTPVHDEASFVMQKYLLLQSEHESLLTSLDTLLVLSHPPSESSTPGVSPTRSFSVPLPRRRHRSSRRGSGASASGSDLETVIDETTLWRLAAEEQRLFDINEGIKRALTQLLNCPGVRGDQAARTWVQGRLMDTEKELRLGRRRRSANAV